MFKQHQSPVAGVQIKKNRKQSGFSLLELGIVVVVIGIILAVALPKVSTVFAGTKSNGELQELPDIIARIQKIYQNSPSFVGATLQTVTDLDAFPAARITTASPAAINNRWGGTITLAVSTLTTANDTINLTYTNVPDTACKEVIQQIANSSGLRVITVGGTTVKADGANVVLATLATQCNAGGAANTVVYRFSK